MGDSCRFELYCGATGAAVAVRIGDGAGSFTLFDAVSCLEERLL
jgi:hypothetical protein